jgi:pimeloyl-ACP methyl ester carboxylesterase
MQSQRVSAAGGVSLHVNVWPDRDGAPFLLVHGLASNARMWDGVAEHLSALGHPVAAIDQRGHGRSDKPDTGYDFTTVTDDLIAAIEQLGLERPVVAGQSWGGNVVLELGWRRPDLVRGVAAVDGGTIELSQRFPDWEACKVKLSPPRLSGTPLADIEARARQFHADWPESGIQGMLANFEVREDGTVAPWLSFERHLLILRGLWEHHPSQRLPEIEAPVLLVPAGQAGWVADKTAAVEAASALLRKGRTAWMAGDHDLHAQFPAEMAALFHGAVDDGFFT